MGLFVVFAFIAAILFIVFFVKILLRGRIRENTIGIFHLYCSSGGGGERVLWHCIKALLSRYPQYTIHIYTHKHANEDPLKILTGARDLFKIDLISDSRIIERLEFIPLKWSYLVEAKRYPYMTLFFQNLASVLLAIQAAYQLTPEVYLETIGFAYTLPVFKLLGCSTITYVHYPTISVDMIKDVSTSTHASFNNREIFVKSSLLRKLKLSYYNVLVYLYRLAGRQADLVIVNSTWTQQHIESLWGVTTNVIFPPCDIDSFNVIYNERKSKKIEKSTNSLNITSIAQFRPEKNHQLQIEAFDYFVNQVDAPDSRLVLYGGCRGAGDHRRVEFLRDLVERLDLNSRIDLVVNAPFEKLLQGMSNSDVALHTMVNEHFGIVLVEFMAAGLITVAHDSGGPKFDIITDGVDGFLARDAIEFGEKLVKISRMDPKERQTMQTNAVTKSKRFSAQSFEERLIRLFEPIFDGGQKQQEIR